MAKPIAATPTVRGQDARQIVEEMINGSPNTPERRETIERSDRTYAEVREFFRAPAANTDAPINR